MSKQYSLEYDSGERSGPSDGGTYDSLPAAQRAAEIEIGETVTWQTSSLPTDEQIWFVECGDFTYTITEFQPTLEQNALHDKLVSVLTWHGKDKDWFGEDEATYLAGAVENVVQGWLYELASDYVKKGSS